MNNDGPNIPPAPPEPRVMEVAIILNSGRESIRTHGSSPRIASLMWW